MCNPSRVLILLMCVSPLARSQGSGNAFLDQAKPLGALVVLTVPGWVAARAVHASAFEFAGFPQKSASCWQHFSERQRQWCKDGPQCYQMQIAIVLLLGVFGHQVTLTGIGVGNKHLPQQENQLGANKQMCQPTKPPIKYILSISVQLSISIQLFISI